MSSRIDRRRLVVGGASTAAIMALLRDAGAATQETWAAQPRSPRAFAANQTVTTLVPGRLHRIGCVARAERLSWLPADLDAWEPLNSYVLSDDTNCVFVDLGMPIARPAMQSALDALVGERRVWVHYTRNEADCIGNLGLVLGTCRNPTLLFGGAGGILEWINDPNVSILEVRDFLGRIPIEQAPNGTTRGIGTLRLQWLEAPLRQMLLTQWVYEESTGCLFTSDFFGFRHARSMDSPIVVDSARGLPASAGVAREIVERMNWLREARIDESLQRLEALFREREVRMIAPVHGCVITGREAIAAHLRLAISALRLAARLPDTERLRYV